MTAPTPLRLDPVDYPPPHGPDHAPCPPCRRLRRQIGHLPIEERAMTIDATPDPVALAGMTPSLRETLSSLTADDRAGFALSSADWRRRAREADLMGHHSTAETFRAVARVADQVALGGEP